MSNFRNVFTAMAMLLALWSCTKQDDAMPEGKGQGMYEITASLAEDGGTRTHLDGNTPKWDKGSDKIWLQYTSGGKTYTEQVEVAEVDANNVAKFYVSRKPEGVMYAAYPYREGTYSVSEGKINFNVPTSQTGTFAEANIMAAISNGTDNKLYFKNAVAIVQVKNDSKNSISLSKIELKGTKIAGNGSMDCSTLNVTSSADASTITVSPSNQTAAVWYIAVMPGASFSGEMATYTGTSKKYKPKSLASAKTAQRKALINLGTPAEKIEAPEGVITLADGSPAEFSVGKNSKVYFAKGNLYYDNGSYKLEDKQYYYRHRNGSDSDFAYFGSSTTTPAGTCGSFYYSENISIATGNTRDDEIKTSTELFTNNPSISINEVQWKCLTYDEWNYLLNTRSNNRFFKGRVNGKNGLFILPDSYTWPAGITKPTKFNNATASFSLYNYTFAEFNTLESNGIAFLPGVGLRGNTNNSNGKCDAEGQVWYAVVKAPYNYQDNMFIYGLLAIDNNCMLYSIVSQYQALPIRLVTAPVN